jgi:hypothetical protein
MSPPIYQSAEGVGRRQSGSERARSGQADRQAAPWVLISGEPGIGKSSFYGDPAENRQVAQVNTYGARSLSRRGLYSWL